MLAKTITTRLVMIGHYLDWLEEENLEAEYIRYTDLLIYMKHSQRLGRSQRTIQHYVGVVKLFYTHLQESGRVKSNPATDIEVKGVKRKVLYYVLDTHELNSIYESYKDESLSGKRNKVMLGLMIYQGVKTEELAKLEVQNVQLREGKIEVPGSRRSNHRTLALESHQVLEIYDYVQNIRHQIIDQPIQGRAKPNPNTQKLFIGYGGSSSSFSNYVSQLMKPLRSKHEQLLNVKQIRTSVIVKWLKQYNLREVQYKAGHRYISTTEGYKQNDIEGLKEEVNQFHPLG